MLELFFAFALIIFGSIRRYCKFEEINISKQRNDNKIKFNLKPFVSPLCSKGGMINYFCEEHIEKLK